MKNIITFLIKLYQRTISPDHGLLKIFYPYGYCRFYPSCSQFGHQAFSKHGTLKGLYLTASRVIRCNPWSDGGIEEIPDNNIIKRK